MYGRTKAAGEAAVTAVLGVERSCILRTSWVYGPVGKNFLLTMLRLLRERDRLGVVSDQVGCPTSTASLAKACWAVLEREVTGIQHWSDAGAASWYDFAFAIAELGEAVGLLPQPALLSPLRTVEYPTPAFRPSYSLLDCTGSRDVLFLKPQHWRTALMDTLQQLVAV